MTENRTTQRNFSPLNMFEKDEKDYNPYRKRKVHFRERTKLKYRVKR